MDELSENKKLKEENAQLRSILGLARRVVSEVPEENLENLHSLKIDHVIRILVVEALSRTKGNRSIAAELLGCARSTLFEYMKKYGIKDAFTRRRKKDWVIEGLYPKETQDGSANDPAVHG